MSAQLGGVVTLFTLPATWIYGLCNRAAPRWIVLSGLMALIVNTVFWSRVYAACYTSQWIAYWIGTVGIFGLYVRHLFDWRAKL
jgi:hypothetical protein